MTFNKNRIFNTLDKIEDKTEIMIHEIPELKHELKLWQDNKIQDLFFFNLLMKYLDSLDSDIKLS
jgi:regulator of replication initiation timing